MKKITLLLSVILISFTMTITSCKKSSPNVDTLQVTFDGTAGSFAKGLSMYVYTAPSQNFSMLYGTDTASVPPYLLTVYIGGTTSGTYSCGNGTTSYIQMTTSGLTFTTNAAGGTGTINISQIDTASKWAKGTFSGTLVGNGPGNDINVTSGTFTVNFILN